MSSRSLAPMLTSSARDEGTVVVQSLITFQGGTKTHAQEALNELDTAEDNFLHVLDAARKICKIFSQFNDADFQITALESLGSDFLLPFRIIRREILQNTKAHLQARNRPVADRHQEQPTINKDTHTCVCPLTLLLRLIARSLTLLHVSVRDNPWGEHKSTATSTGSPQRAYQQRGADDRRFR
ncbi:hypothetical protein S7711_11027 [Stachybotrys chartarum IBT 7711]|uniref:Uncharacterized protein n=1 Tax=Stachybotrys chartarum (strain CBS 109288 / IBT 7711) TaxID=1280523 RepID=A0A084B4Z1_STACB|nr:hypothetical protein S7711_11027 [Stachybotrys chartarum IBT 7711]